MKTYRVKYEQTIIFGVDVQANSRAGAIEMVRRKLETDDDWDCFEIDCGRPQNLHCDDEKSDEPEL